MQGYVGTSCSLRFGGGDLWAMSGLRIVVDHTMVDRVQFRFPRSKKRRIRKKWAKQPKNWKTVPRQNAYQIGGTIIMHPAMAAELERQLPRVSSWGPIPIADCSGVSVP